MGHRLHRPQSSQARTQADSVRGVAVGRWRGLNKAGGVTNQVTPHPIHHRAWPMSIRHDNLDRLLAGGVVAGFLAVTLIPSFSVAAPVEDSTPQLGSRDFGWNVNFWDFQLDPPQGSAHGPIKTDPNYPYNSQIQNGGFLR